MSRFRVPVLLAGLLMAACAPQPSTPPIGDLCVSKAAFEASLESFRALEPSATAVDDYQEAWILVQRTFRDYREHAVELADDQVTEVDQALDAVEQALDDVPSDATPEEATGVARGRAGRCVNGRRCAERRSGLSDALALGKP